MSEEADSAAAAEAVLARLGPVTTRVEPALKDAMGELTGISFLAVSFSELGAGGAGVVVLPGISSAGLLPGVSEGALRPVMRSPARATPHLELEHAEMIAGEGVDGVRRRVRLIAQRVRLSGEKVVRREITVERGEGLEVMRAVSAGTNIVEGRTGDGELGVDPGRGIIE